MSKENQPPIRLVSKRNGASYTISRRAASISGFVVSALEQDPNAVDIEVDLDGEVLDAITSYVNRHNGTEAPYVEKPLRSRLLQEVCPDANDAVFMDGIHERSIQLLYDVTMGALYLHIPGLLHLGCAKIASLIKGQPLDKIKDILVPRRSATHQ